MNDVRGCWNMDVETVVQLTIDDHDMRRSYLVPKGLLCYHSEYFRKAFEGEFVEKDEHSIHLLDVSERTLRLFLRCLYGQGTRRTVNAVPTNNVNKRSTRATKQDEERSMGGCEWAYAEDFQPIIPREEFNTARFVELYAFADEYDTMQLRRDIVTVLLPTEACAVVHHSYWPSVDYESLFDMLPDNLPLCQYFVHSRIMILTEDEVLDPNDFPPSFFVQATRMLLRLHHAKDKRLVYKENFNSCTYHEHEGGVDDEAHCKADQAHDRRYLLGFLQAIMAEIGKEDGVSTSCPTSSC
ncbi:hypothetical protein BDV96DRAFT_600135 [Lophiotrema nucula]|uniref:BTB domain-containing protein n=1 Tax=Lophiotrema nucula TaxID=690887 RepID=A0A6A5Z7H0_9PLEO|nr:hypothetical protein BDV96DRAFT_600135 [Lophiotrema nucula]